MSMKKENNAHGFIALAIFLLAVVPTAWFLLDINDIPSKIGVPMSLGPGQWSVIFVGYFASVLGAITGFIATAYSVKKSIENQNRTRREDNAIAALPLIQINCDTNNSKECSAIITCKYDTLGNVKNKTYTIGVAGIVGASARVIIKNVGQREMYNLCVKCIKNGYFLGSDKMIKLLPIVYKNEGIPIGLDICTAVAKGYYESPMELLADSKYSTEKLIIALVFDDCYGNRYEQRAEIDVSYGQRNVGGKIYKVFENSVVKTCGIISAPKVVHRNKKQFATE